MREPAGTATPPPAISSERAWSKRREPHFRNVEAEGSNPFTSTDKSRSAPQNIFWFAVATEDWVGRAVGGCRRQRLLYSAMIWRFGPVGHRKPL